VVANATRSLELRCQIFDLCGKGRNSSTSVTRRQLDAIDLETTLIYDGNLRLYHHRMAYESKAEAKAEEEHGPLAKIAGQDWLYFVIRAHYQPHED
jgi:hypothetical protein